MADTSTGTTLTWNGAVTEIVSIGGPSASNDPVDVTNLSSTWKAFIASVPDGGEVTLELNYEPDLAAHAGFLTDLGGGTERQMVITFADGGGTTLTFNAICTGFAPNAATADKLSCTVTFKVTGAIA